MFCIDRMKKDRVSFSPGFDLIRQRNPDFLRDPLPLVFGGSVSLPLFVKVLKVVGVMVRTLGCTCTVMTTAHSEGKASF